MITTEVANTLATITYPIRHELTEANPTANTTTDLDRWGGANTYILVTGLAERQFHGHDESYDYAQLVGRVVPVRPSRPLSEQWYLSADDNDGSGGYLTGARINPALVNGHLYQELRNLSGEHHSSPFILRYNDDDHRSERANLDNPWTIVWAQDGLEHQIGMARVATPFAYVEVRNPLRPFSPVTTGLATDEDIELILAEVDEDAAVVRAATDPAYITNSTIGHTLGMAHAEDNGQVLLDPERVNGEMYLTWHNGTTWYDDHAVIQTWVNENFRPVGWVNRGVDGGVYVHSDLYIDVRGPAIGAADRETHWAKLGFTSPEVSPEAEERETALVQEATDAHEAFENLNDALNVLAREQSWCGEYERTMQGIGMRDRRSGRRMPYDPENLLDAVTERHAWDVEYSVDVTMTDDSLSYRVSSMLESEYEVSNVSEIRFEATVNVTIRGIVADSEGEAEDLVDRSSIENELDAILQGEYEITDYSHVDTNEDEDFDWDEYGD